MEINFNDGFKIFFAPITLNDTGTDMQFHIKKNVKDLSFTISKG